MVSDAVIAFGIVWLPGIILAIWVWRVSAADAKHPRPSIGFRALYLGVVFAPSVIHAHGDYYVPALFYSLYVFTGDILGTLLYGLVPMLVTASLAYAVMFSWFAVSSRTR